MTNQQPPLIDFVCLSKGCSNTFKALQGSRRLFCDACRDRRAVDGLKAAIASRRKKGAG